MIDSIRVMLRCNDNDNDNDNNSNIDKDKDKTKTSDGETLVKVNSMVGQVKSVLNSIELNICLSKCMTYLFFLRGFF